jgi:hypothetical protein
MNHSPPWGHSADGCLLQIFSRLGPAERQQIFPGMTTNYGMVKKPSLIKWSNKLRKKARKKSLVFLGLNRAKIPAPARAV